MDGLIKQENIFGSQVSKVFIKFKVYKVVFTLKSIFCETYIPKSEFWNEINQGLINSKVVLWNSFFDF